MAIAFFGTALVDIILTELSEKLEHESLYAAKYHQIFPGGKAVNQAACASLFSSKTKILAKIGSDEFGNLIRIEIEKKGVETDSLLTDFALPTGFVVLVPEINSNFKSVLVSYGASLKISNFELKKVENHLLNSKIIVGGLELNIGLVKELLAKAKKKGLITIIDPYPPEKADVEVLALADIITPNREEGSIISGRDIKSIFAAKMAVKELLKMGIKNVCLKLGADGVVIGNQDNIEHVKPVRVQAIDPTGGGDVFAGVLSSLILRGHSVVESSKIANYASALSVTRKGAFNSIPLPREVMEFMIHRSAEENLIKIMDDLVHQKA